MKKKHKTGKKSLHKRIFGHTWDETLVIIVMITAALSILILVVNQMAVTGKAYSSVIPDKKGIINMLNKAEVLKGSGKMKCESRIGCGKLGRTCVLAKESGVIADCDKILSGDYYCVCVSPTSVR